MRLIVQPGDGIMPLIDGITAARSSVEIVIFRSDRKEIERALAAAVSRGVSVRALIAHTNRAGEENLRKLELRLLAAGVMVSRTADDLARYHSKLMIIDRRELYLLAFNLTYADIEHSRSFGLITGSRKLVHEAIKVFEADAQRHPYQPSQNGLVVSPVNARKALSKFLKGAKKSLIIYDPKVSDPAMMSLLQDRAKAGVEIRLIGRLARRDGGVTARKPRMRLHTRTIVRDGEWAFIGSQSLRALELDARREVGIIFRDSQIITTLVETFEEDWTRAEQSTQQTQEDAAPVSRVARKVAKALTKDLPPVAQVLNGAVKELVGDKADVDLNADEVEQLVKEAVKDAVKEVVRDVVEEVVEHNAERAH